MSDELLLGPLRFLVDGSELILELRVAFSLSLKVIEIVYLDRLYFLTRLQLFAPCIKSFTLCEENNQ